MQIVEIKTCEVEHSVSDADFGYWSPTWGEAPVHVFLCGAEAVVIMQDPGDDEGVALCAEHAMEALR